jgi:hypothetical protein
MQPKRPAWFDSEIAWYVNEWEGEAGLRGVSLEPGTGGVEDHDGIPDTAVRAATRARRVEAAFRRVGPGSEALRLAHRTLSPRLSLGMRQRVEAWVEAKTEEIGELVQAWRQAAQKGRQERFVVQAGRRSMRAAGRAGGAVERAAA